MCGLGGGYNPNGMKKAHKKIATELLYVAGLRGLDSTGAIIGFNRGDKPTKFRTLHTVYSPGHLVDTFEYWNCCQKDLTMIVGHARAATIGNVDLDNCQPCHTGDTILTHNGTINTLSLEATARKMSDSRILTEMVDKEGLYSALQQCQGGAWAIVSVDTDLQTISFVRNDKRTLYMVDYENTLFWSSEEGMLDMVLQRNGAKPTDYESVLLRTDLILEFDMDKTLDDYTKIDCEVTEEVWGDTSDYVYRGWERQLMPLSKVQPLLDMGCTMTGEVASPEETVYWLSESCYVTEEAYFDNIEFLSEYSADAYQSKYQPQAH